MGWVWIVIGIMGLGLAVLGLRAFVLGGFSGHGPAQARDDGADDVPLSLQQVRAWWGLGIAGTVSIVLVVIVAVMGPAGYWQSRESRLAGWAVLLVGGLAYAVMLWVSRARPPGSAATVDERDRAIMARGLSVALVAGLLNLAAWTVGLTEAYWSEQEIPIDYLRFILWSTLLAALLGREVGILMGYAGWHSRGES